MTHSQTSPSGNPPPNNTNAKANQAWYRGGNNLAYSTPVGANIFGTNFNSPIYTVTNSTIKTKLNGNLNYGVGGYAASQKNGYFLLGFTGGYASGLNAANFGAYSLLHLNGPNGDFVQTGGYRPWMQTGVTFTDNDDLSYMGLRSVGVGDDITETTIAWSDNAGGGTTGPDQMVFRFTSSNVQISGAVANSVSSNLLAVNDLDGLHIARFTATGFMGLGNTFGVVDPIYVQPQSLSHLSLSDNRDVWTQYTNRTTSALNSGTGENAGDGLRIGIISENLPGVNGTQGNGTAMIYNQENRPILFSTNNTTDASSSLNTNERVRIMNVNTPTELPNGTLGVYNPAGVNGNLTRMSVSHNSANPVTRPLSLLHLGYNTGENSLIAGATDGWRNWMDIGTFTTNGTDNVYVGLKNEGSVDNFDAVINWGDNQSGLLPSGPDHLRFIFTSTTSGLGGSPVALSNDGLETMRIVPIYDTAATDAWVIADNGNGNSETYGRVGIGDFTAQGVNEEPTHKLDVVGNGRFRFLPDSLYKATPDVTRYVMVDSMGVLRWSDTLIQNSANVFAPCTDSSGLSDLAYDSKLNLNNFNLYFETEDGLNTNDFGIGYECGEPLPGQVSVYTSIDLYSGHYYVSNANPINPNFQGGVYSIIDSVYSDSPIAMHGIVTTNMSPTTHLYHVGVLGEVDATNVKTAIGVEGESKNGGIGGYFKADGNGLAIGVVGVQATVQNSLTGGSAVLAHSQGAGNNGNTGVNSTAIGHNVTNANYGVLTTSLGTNSLNYGVHTMASGGGSATSIGIYSSGTTWAGYFTGDVFISGTYGPSDENLKQNIDSLSLDSASFYINALNPSTFEYQTSTYPYLNLGEGHQYGLIAQEVEEILPSCIQEINHPAQYDSLGNEISPAMTFKGLDYEQFIPILIADAKNKNVTIDGLEERVDTLETIVEQQDSLISDLNSRLTTLENCLSSILPFLCQINNNMIQENSEETQNQIRTMLQVELRDENSIVLEQNVPNPFAEQTVINYSIPETVGRAQLLFYNDKGQLIQTVEIPERGLGQLTVFASDLSTGIYSYTLVADGVVVSTKRMVKTN